MDSSRYYTGTLTDRFWDIVNPFKQQIAARAPNQEVLYAGYHVPQKFSWDCGIACIEMVLKWIGIPESRYRWHLNELYLRSSPLWTVELFCFLREKFYVDCSMSTLCVGVNPSHLGIDWYSQHWSSHELGRIQRSFDSAAENSWIIEKVRIELWKNAIHNLPYEFKTYFLYARLVDTLCSATGIIIRFIS